MSTRLTEDNRLNNIDGFVNFILQQVEVDAQDGQQLLKLGAKNTLAQIIASIAGDPFSFCIDNIKRNHTELIKMVDAYVLSYVRAKQSLIEKGYKFYTSTGINYFLILKEDNTENREVFFELLDHYETLNIDDNLPVNISFLPIEACGKINSVEEISFS